MRYLNIKLGVVLAILFFASGGYAYDLKDNIPAPSFPDHLPWLNVERPLELSDLRGKVVILDFWTYGCINCIHVMDELEQLEQKYGQRLVVIGVHSPKFDNEKNIETLRRVLVRYQRTHPVVHDTDFKLIRRYAVRAWPTLFVLDPAGGVVGRVRGEGHLEILEQVVGELLEAYADELDDTPLPLAPEIAKFEDSLLAFPGKVAVSEEYVAVSDTLHNRIVLAGHDGKIRRFFGDGKAGLLDGPAAEARFSAPQGLVFAADRLYVADTGNHAIRLIDLGQGTVSTIAGTGKVGRRIKDSDDATSLDLRSPWDLALRDQQLYIAMAGQHQIWRMDLEAGRIEAYAGSGHEGITDGSLDQAEFSQPSGLSFAGDWLYVADAEDSAVRRIHTKLEKVETLVGTGLFDFGDRDGAFAQAQLQHVLGIAAIDEGEVVIADTYNHKLKRLDIKARTVATLAGTGEPGREAAQADRVELNEPGGVALLDKKILIADTNNHRILYYDLDAQRIREWRLFQ